MSANQQRTPRNKPASKRTRKNSSRSNLWGSGTGSLEHPLSVLAKRIMPPLIISLDPGDHVGWAIFEQGKRKISGMHFTKENTYTSNLDFVWNLIVGTQPTGVVCERYKIFASMTGEHSNSDVPTLRLIGAIEQTCRQNGIPLAMQMPGEAKQFITSDKLNILLEGYKIPTGQGMHEEDAIKHGFYYLMVKTKKKSPERLEQEGLWHGSDGRTATGSSVANR